jgi:chromosome segregation ATPase
VKSAGDKLKEYRSQLDKTTQAERSLTSAQRNRSQAQRSLDDANQDLLDAQTAFNQAVAGYGKDSAQARDAERALLRAQRERERAGYRVEESVFAVADAEKELSDARKDPETTPQRIRELEIRLAEAKLSVADATDSEVEATTNLSSAQSKLNEIVNGATIGSAVYETLLRAVNTAKDRQEEATYRLQQAILAEADAVKKLREEYKELANAAEAAGKTFNIPNIPVPSPAASGMRIMPDTVDKPAVVVNVTAGIGGNAYQVGKEIIEVLDQYTSVAGPLDTLMRVV